jgi:hypothetical protein
MNYEIIKKYINLNKYGYKLLKINYSIKEKKIINNFKIINGKTFSYYGSINKLNVNNLIDFFKNISNEKSEIHKIIIKIIKSVLKGYKLKYFWIDIRATLPTDYFDEPRWHKDGIFFVETGLGSYKFATTLIGPGTLIMKTNDKINKIYNNLQNKMIKSDYDPKYRTILNKKLKDEKFKKLKNNDGIIFYTGDYLNDENNNGVLHSEPKKDVPRLFISILPGTRDNIINLQERWKK